MKKHKIVIAVTGASGAIYAQLLIAKLQQYATQIQNVGIVFSRNAKDVWQHELGNTSYENLPFPIYDRTDFFAPFASGSAGYTTMIIVPCSMGTLARIAHGTSDDLITRAADVVLKERRRLILMTRDTPLSLVHIRNMLAVTEAGGIVVPASPSFYSRPQSIEELASTVVDRILDLAGLDIDTYRWSE
jgi:4-hydroxy-3-polyprenylbenzoate decarboxylase